MNKIPNFHIDQEVYNPLREIPLRRAFIGGIIPFEDEDKFYYWLRYEYGEEIEEAMQTIWDEEQLRDLMPCKYCEGTGKGYSGKHGFFCLDCEMCDGTGKSRYGL